MIPIRERTLGLTFLNSNGIVRLRFIAATLISSTENEYLLAFFETP
jgi:hypothetical protein